MNAIVKLGLDVYNKTVQTEFTNGKDAEVELRNKLIELNGGSDKINLKSQRNNGSKIFEVVETVLDRIVEEGMQGDEFFHDCVDYINMKLGDRNEFVIPGNSELFVAEMANGIATPRRQRIGEKTSVAVPTKTYGIRVYEELDRLLAGRTTWNTFIDAVSEAIMKARYEAIYTAFSGISASTDLLNDKYVIGGTFAEEDLLNLIAHVEAATGKTARIIGTKAALRKITTAVLSEEAKSDLYNVGHYGKFAGTEMTAIKNIHKPGSMEFLLPDNKIWVVAGDDKFIKFVTEGDPIIVEGDPLNNADLSQEYAYIEKYGCMVVLSSVLGMFTFTA